MIGIEICTDPGNGADYLSKPVAFQSVPPIGSKVLLAIEGEQTLALVVDLIFERGGPVQVWVQVESYSLEEVYRLFGKTEEYEATYKQVYLSDVIELLESISAPELPVSADGMIALFKKNFGSSLG